MGKQRICLLDMHSNILFTEEQLVKIGLNSRQVKAVLYVKERGKITNKVYQEMNDVSRNTASSELKELENVFGILINKGQGAGSFYELIAQ